MRVAYLVNQYPQLSHTFIRREILAVEQHGIEVVRLSIRPPGPLADAGDRAEEGRTTVILTLGTTALLAATLRLLVTRPGRWLRAARQAVRLARAGGGWVRHLAYLVEACAVVRRCDRDGVGHLHAHFGTNPASVALLARTLGGPPFSFTTHGPEEFDRPAALSLEEKIAAAAFVAGVSSFGRSQLYRHCPADRWGMIHVVRCGLDASYLSAETTPVPDVARLVCVGRLCEQKGQLLLVRAAALVRDRGRAFELVLVGDGPLRGAVECEVARLDLGNTVRLLGPLPGERVRQELTAGRAMVLPSFAEGLPVVLMEALAAGRPVVTTYIAGIPELVTPECGWLVPAGAVEPLADAMEAVLNASSTTLTAMGKTGALRVAEMHDAATEAGRLTILFRNSEGLT